MKCNKCAISITIQSRLYFSADTLTEMNEWIGRIRSVIDTLRHSSKKQRPNPRKSIKSIGDPAPPPPPPPPPTVERNKMACERNNDSINKDEVLVVYFLLLILGNAVVYIVIHAAGAHPLQVTSFAKIDLWDLSRSRTNWHESQANQSLC